jgi:hypothetical protein
LTSFTSKLNSLWIQASSGVVVPGASQMNDTCCRQQIIPKSVRHNLGLQNPNPLSKKYKVVRFHVPTCLFVHVSCSALPPPTHVCRIIYQFWRFHVDKENNPIYFEIIFIFLHTQKKIFEKKILGELFFDILTNDIISVQDTPSYYGMCFFEGPPCG